MKIGIIKKMVHRFRRNHHSMCGKVKSKQVNLEWWNYRENLGDSLSPLIVKWMLTQKGIDMDKKVSKTRHFLALGSIIALFDYDATIWGTGIHKFSSVSSLTLQKKYIKYDIRSVRGPITRQAFIELGYDCPEIYGDPAILMPEIYVPCDIEKKYEYTLIQHFSEKDDQNQLINKLNIETSDYQYFIDSIVQSKCVISSSLHGIILAESYGIPAVFLCTEKNKEIVKYIDWYWSTGRYSIKVANTVEEAMSMEKMPLPNIEVLESMRMNIKNAFPYDLWEV